MLEELGRQQRLEGVIPDTCLEALLDEPARVDPDDVAQDHRIICSRLRHLGVDVKEMEALDLILYLSGGIPVLTWALVQKLYLRLSQTRGRRFGPVMVSDVEALWADRGILEELRRHLNRSV